MAFGVRRNHSLNYMYEVLEISHILEPARSGSVRKTRLQVGQCSSCNVHALFISYLLLYRFDENENKKIKCTILSRRNDDKRAIKNKLERKKWKHELKQIASNSEKKSNREKYKILHQ